MSNILDPDQDRHCVGPDLGPNCLQRLSADDGKSIAWKELGLVHHLELGKILQDIRTVDKRANNMRQHIRPPVECKVKI